MHANSLHSTKANAQAMKSFVMAMVHCVLHECVESGNVRISVSSKSLIAVSCNLCVRIEIEINAWQIFYLPIVLYHIHIHIVSLTLFFVETNRYKHCFVLSFTIHLTRPTYIRS